MKKASCSTAEVAADSIDVDGKVYFATEEEVTPGDIIKVKILDADEYDLTGQAEVI